MLVLIRVLRERERETDRQTDRQTVKGCPHPIGRERERERASFNPYPAKVENMVSS
jgi:hypothetical protein